MSRLAMVRGVAALLLVLAYALLAQASERLARRAPARAPHPESAVAPPRPAGELDAFAREMDEAIARLEKEAAAPLPETPAAVPIEVAVARVIREEMRAQIRSAVLATAPERLARLTRELGLTAEEVPPVRAALARVTDTLADRWADRAADAPDAPAPLEEWARAALRIELARILAPDRLARFDAGSCFREEEAGR